MNLPDISEWYTPERISAEDEICGQVQGYSEYVDRIWAVCRKYGLITVLEVGCGSGWVPLYLDSSLIYVAGIDKNPHRIKISQSMNPRTLFIERDLRLIKSLDFDVDLVFSFAVMKHFSLEEWPECLKATLSMGRYGLFDQHVLMDDRAAVDLPVWDGKEGFHSIWPTRAEVVKAVNDAGHEILDFDDSYRFDGSAGAPEVMITTRRSK